MRSPFKHSQLLKRKASLPAALQSLDQLCHCLSCSGTCWNAREKSLFVALKKYLLNTISKKCVLICNTPCYVI